MQHEPVEGGRLEELDEPRFDPSRYEVIGCDAYEHMVVLVVRDKRQAPSGPVE